MPCNVAVLNQNILFTALNEVHVASYADLIWLNSFLYFLCSWPKVKNFDSKASDFVLEMLDIYGYEPLDELRDGNSNESVELATDMNEDEDRGDESYNYMKNGIRPDILYVTDTAAEIQEALALQNEKRDIRAVSRKEIGWLTFLYLFDLYDTLLHLFDLYDTLLHQD